MSHSAVISPSRLDGAAVAHRARGTVRTNAAWMIAGRLTFHACQLGVLMTLAAQGGPEAVGQFVLGLAVCAPLFTLASLQLGLAQSTAQGAAYRFGEFLRLRFATTVLAGVATLIAACCVADSPMAAAVIMAVGCAKSVETLSDLYCGRLLKHEQLAPVARSLALRGVISWAVIVATLSLTGNLLVAVLLYGGAWWLVCWFHDRRLALRCLEPHEVEPIRFPWSGTDVARLRRLAWQTAPLGVAGGVAALELNLPRYVAHWQFGPWELGIVGVVTYVATFGQLINAAAAQAAFPRLAQLFTQGLHGDARRLLVRLCGFAVATGGAATLAAATLGPPLLAWAFGAEYVSAADLLTWAAFASIGQFVATMFSAALRAGGHYRAELVGRTATLGLTAVACGWCAAQFGLNGIGYGLVGGSAASALAFGLLTAAHWKVAVPLAPICVAGTIRVRRDPPAHLDRPADLAVLHVARSIGRGAYGVGVVAKSLVDAQRSAGHTAVNWSTDPAGEAAETLGDGTPLRSGFGSFGPRRWGYSPQLRRALTGEAGGQFDLLHQHSVWSYCSRATAAWRERWQRPVMITPHGALEPWTLRTSAWKKRAAWYGYERGNLAAAACLQALCAREAQSLRDLGLANPIAHIPNGVAVDEFALPGDGPEFRRRHALPAEARVMLFFSRVTPKKGLPLLLEALAQRRQAWRDWMLVIAGPDERGHAGELLALARKLGLGQRVRWIGPIFGAEVRDAFAASELMALPTHSEGSPMVVLEALAAQTPVLTTRGAPAEFLEEHGCGWQTAIDADALGAALEQACRLDPHALQAMGLRGRQLVCERFAWASVARQTVAAYQWLLGEGPRPEFVELPRSETIVLPTRPALRRAS